jgi:hypothetical protein
VRTGGAMAMMLLLTMTCDRGRDAGISKDPQPSATAPIPPPMPDAGADAAADADAEGGTADARADAEPPPIEIQESAAPKTTGTIPVAYGDVDALAKAVAEPFGACYHDARVRDPMVAGVLVVRFAILTNGKVDAPAAGGKTLRDPDLLDCVVVALRRLEFTPPPTTKQIVSHAFAFRS